MGTVENLSIVSEPKGFIAARAPSEPPDDVGTVTWLITSAENSLSITGSDRVTIDPSKLGQGVYGTVSAESQGADTALMSYKWKVTTSNKFMPQEPPPKAVDCLVIRLHKVTIAQGVDTKIPVTLLLGKIEYKLELPLSLKASPATIKTFRATPSIVVIGRKTKLQWECKDATSVLIDSKEQQNPETCETTMNTSGLIPYELVAKNSAKDETKAALTVKVLDNSAWVAAPKWWDGQVVGLCVSVSPDGETLYAVVRSASGAAVWSSADGFSRWEQVATVPADQNVVTTSPVVCVQMASGPVLMFVGGSKMDYEDLSSKVWSLDLKTTDWTSQDAEWTARMGHACVVAPDADGADKVWVIGGMDQSGNVLNDAWVSANGHDWAPKNVPNDWKGRCLFGAAAKTKDKKSEIWLGGGFDGPDGKPLTDLKVWNAANLDEQEILLTLSDKDWILSGLALAALGQQIYVAGVERQPQQNVAYQYIFDPVGTDASGTYKTLSTTKVNSWGGLEQPASKIDAVGFNGCLWLCSLRAGPKHHEIETKGLYYWVPPPPA